MHGGRALGVRGRGQQGPREQVSFWTYDQLLSLEEIETENNNNNNKQ